MEVNRIKRQKNDEFQEELRVKMETQGQLLHVFNEHNRSLQIQVSDIHVHRGNKRESEGEGKRDIYKLREAERDTG